MKIFTNRSVVQKIVIVLMTVIILTFSIPKPVSADFGGVLASPVISLATLLVDSVQWILEWVMLGEANYFMDQTYSEYEEKYSSLSDEEKNETGYTIDVTQKIDGSFLGLDTANIPDIQYTPEEIFSNRIPALDINFINPSVTTGNETTDNKMNVAIKLQPIISSWYVALRTLAIVGLLSVLVYLGIRMLLTSVAADRAKYKKMLMDWLVAMCLLFALHYIMSFTLTMSEVITSLISQDTGKTVTVNVLNQDAFFGSTSYTFQSNLMNYVRFMIQCTDFTQKVGFFFLYLMLVIYTVRFTWTYLKRVVNIAFLTLVAPIVALTYPIDRASDGKAQAFDMWIKEYVFNAILQPVHLLLYTVILSSATELAITNPLYAIVCLGFIFAAEKLLKQMFNFGKASGGTLASLAGAAGVTMLANKALMAIGKGPNGGKGGGNGKVRTNDQTTRQGRNQGANKGYNAFDTEHNQGLNELPAGNTQGGSDGDGNELRPPLGGDGGDGNEPPPPLGGNGGDGNEPPPPLGGNGGNGNEPPPLGGNDEADEQDEGEEEQQGAPDTSGSPNPEMTDEALQNLGSEQQPETWRTLWDQDRQEAYEAKKQKRLDKAEARYQKRLDKESGELSRKRKIAAYKTIRGIKAAAPAVGRKVLKTAARGAVGLALGATAGVIGATTGDGEKALSMAAGGFGVGFATGDDLFEATVGKATNTADVAVKDAYGAGKYGSAIDARNEKADKAYLKSAEHAEEYEKYFKKGSLRMSKKEYDDAVKQYREVGITDKKKIRDALKLEAQYKKNNADNRHGRNNQEIRGKVQNIVQTYDNVSKKAVYGEDKNATEAALNNIESQLTNVPEAQRRSVANEILQGYRDWYNI